MRRFVKKICHIMLLILNAVRTFVLCGDLGRSTKYWAARSKRKTGGIRASCGARKSGWRAYSRKAHVLYAAAAREIKTMRAFYPLRLKFNSRFKTNSFFERCENHAQYIAFEVSIHICFNIAASPKIFLEHLAVITQFLYLNTNLNSPAAFVRAGFILRSYRQSNALRRLFVVRSALQTG